MVSLYRFIHVYYLGLGFRSLAVLIFGFLSHGALFRAWGRIYLFIGSCAGALRDSF